MKINRLSENIEFPGWWGTWYTLETAFTSRGKLYLMEHEQYGEDTEHLIVDHEGNIVMDDVWNGFEDYFAFYC